MGKLTLAATVATPIEQVFDYVVDPKKAPEMFRAVKELRQLSPGPLGKGSKLLAVRGPFDEEFTVAEYDPPRSYVLQGGIPRPATTLGYWLEPESPGTRVEFGFEWRLRGAWRVIAPLFHRRMRREYAETFAHVVDRLTALEDVNPGVR